MQPGADAWHQFQCLDIVILDRIADGEIAEQIEQAQGGVLDSRVEYDLRPPLVPADLQLGPDVEQEEPDVVLLRKQ